MSIASKVFLSLLGCFATPNKCKALTGSNNYWFKNDKIINLKRKDIKKKRKKKKEKEEKEK